LLLNDDSKQGELSKSLRLALPICYLVTKAKLTITSKFISSRSSSQNLEQGRLAFK